MTIIEELREIAQRKCNCHEVVRMFGFACGESPCTECIPRLIGAISDRIDAERALPEGIEWPRFEDGELVKIGDEVEFEDETMRVFSVAFTFNGWVLWCARESFDGRLCGSYGELVKRPTLKVLDADGAPIEVGDTVYCDDDPEQLIVDSFDDPGCVYLTPAKSPSGMLYTIEPSRLSHQCHDSWERLEEDAAKRVCEYAGAQKSIVDADRFSCVDCPYDEPGPHTDAGCNERMRLDLMRRAKALAKADE